MKCFLDLTEMPGKGKIPTSNDKFRKRVFTSRHPNGREGNRPAAFPSGRNPENGNRRGIFFVTRKFSFSGSSVRHLTTPSSWWLTFRVRRSCGPGGKAPLWEGQSVKPIDSKNTFPREDKILLDRLVGLTAWRGPQKVRGRGMNEREVGN